MADPDADLITYAREAATRGEDLFLLLSVDATASESDIRRAFRKKALTAHPDKAGDNYDPALYARLEKGRDVLLTPAAREVYDNGMRALLQKKVERDAMSARRRRLVEELEAREKEAENNKKMKVEEETAVSQEVAAMAARGRAKIEERRRLLAEAEERERLAKEMEERERDQKIEELERRLREIERRKAEKKARKAGKKEKVESSQVEGEAPVKRTREKEEEGQTATETATASADNAPPPPTNDTAPPTANMTTSTTAQGGGGFPALMARLKAAQAKKEEEKKRRAMEEAMKA